MLAISDQSCKHNAQWRRPIQSQTAIRRASIRIPASKCRPFQPPVACRSILPPANQTCETLSKAVEGICIVYYQKARLPLPRSQRCLCRPSSPFDGLADKGNVVGQSMHLAGMRSALTCKARKTVKGKSPPGEIARLIGSAWERTCEWHAEAAGVASDDDET